MDETKQSHGSRGTLMGFPPKDRPRPQTTALERKEGGYLCRCGGSTGVIDSRAGTAGNYIRRRRECADCGARTTTFEQEIEGAAGVLERAESLGHRAEILAEAAAALLTELDGLKELTDAHRTIEKAHYGNAERS